MRVIPLHNPTPALPSPTIVVEQQVQRTLRRTLFGSTEHVPLPAISDLLGATLALVEGRRRKSLLPLATAPAELVLLRDGDHARVSYYLSDGPTEVRVLDRPVSLRELLAVTLDAASQLSSVDADPISRQLATRLVERARRAKLAPIAALQAPVHVRGGATTRPGADVPLAFGFGADIAAVGASVGDTDHTDLHALLFSGELWLWTRGRQIPLLRGPIVLAIARMIAGARALVDAMEAGRGANVRLRAGRFLVGVRLSLQGEVNLALGDGGRITVPALSVEHAVLPILRLATDVLRALVSVDRTQSRNLRVTGLRDEVRSLRRRLRKRAPRLAERVVHDDPEQLRASAGIESPPADAPEPTPRALRFDVRWEAELAGLDAASTFLCGDRMVIATPRQTACLDREDGTVLWSHERPAEASFMAGTSLVQVAPDGRVDLVSLEDGEPYASHGAPRRTSGPALGIFAGGRSVPPVVVLSAGKDRLLAIDLRNGELRWRAGFRGESVLSLSRQGRILLASTASTVCAHDVANGELLWRYSTDSPIHGSVGRAGEVVLAATERSLVGLDLFSGRTLFERELDGRPASAPFALGDLAAIAVGESGEGAALVAFEPEGGRLRWMVPDPGVAQGASCLVVDRTVVVNAPAGRLVGLSLDDGHTLYERAIAHPVADDVPRRLEPVLRGGAMFIPSAEVHVVRPHDGEPVGGGAVPCDLVPDWMRVDERGWIFVAEESGHVSALAPRPHAHSHLRLVK